MKTGLSVVAGLALVITGCGSCGTKTGWRLEILEPPVVMSPSLVASGPAALGTVGLGTVQHSETQAVQLIQQGPCVTQSPARRPVQSTAPDCETLEQACERIRALERELRIRRPEMSPMPKKAEDPYPKEEE